MMSSKEAIIKEIDALDKHYEAICNDPLNGCPGDFAEDWSRKRDNLMHKLWEQE